MAGNSRHEKKIAHEYFGIDLDIIWQSIEEDLVPLEKTVKKMFHDLYEN